MLRSRLVGLAAVAAFALAAAASAHASVALTQVSADPFTNSDSQHATAVEPDTFASGSNIVAASQLGRYTDGGASGIGYAYSTNSGTSWTSGGALPGLTDNQTPAGSFNRATDPAVAYDAKHGVWLVISLGLTDTNGVTGTGVVVSPGTASTDGLTLTFGNPITVASAGRGSDFDKTWIACDNTPTSPFFGNCYATWDDFAHGDALKMSTSSDGGVTWGRAKSPGGAAGLGGQPVVQKNGTVIVPFANAYETAIGAFRSTNGGAKWSSPVLIANASSDNPDGGLRSGPLPSAEIAGDDKVYVAWQNCALGVQACPYNDIVMSTSTDGVHWTAVTRVPIADVTSTQTDHFIPGLGVDRSTSGSTTKLGLTYYYYPNANCGSSCTLGIGYVQSNNGGTTWSDPLFLGGMFSIGWIANTNQGPMVGDYMSTSWSGGNAWPAVSVAAAPSGNTLAQDLEVPSSALAPVNFVHTASSGAAAPTTGQGTAHAILRSRR